MILKKDLEVSVLDGGTGFDDQGERQVDTLVQRVGNLHVDDEDNAGGSEEGHEEEEEEETEEDDEEETEEEDKEDKDENDPVCGEESADSGQLERGDCVGGSKVRMGSDQQDFCSLLTSLSL